MATLEGIADPAAFVREAGAFLTAREAEHNLMLGLALRAVDDPGAFAEPVYEVVVRGDDGAVVAAALRTPPYHLVLSEAEAPDVAELVAADARERFGDLPGVLGPAALAAAFAGAWTALTGAAATLELAERIYRADRAEAPGGVPGTPREAGPSDRSLLLAWNGAFQAEALPEASRVEAPEELLARRERDPHAGYLLWERDGEPVALAGWGGRTPNGVRLGPVYTPPEHRGRGYASAVTAAATDRLLRGGRRFCFLFTDLANPTSNAIYQRIGYRPVSDVDQYRFGPAGS